MKITTNDTIKTSTKVWQYSGRFAIWAVVYGGFIFSLAFLIASNMGLSTLDAFAEPLRHLFGAKNSLYGKAFLIPISSTMITVAIVISYIRHKKIRLDYVFAYIPIIVLGFILDEILKIDFFLGLLTRSFSENIPFVDEPIRILYSLIGFILFVFTLGALAPLKIAPNSFVIFVTEIAVITNKKYSTIQWISDIALILIGIVFMSISISAGIHDDAGAPSWYEMFKIAGPTTVVILLFQGAGIDFVIKQTDAIVNKKLFKETASTL